ncbi:MAG: DUF1232 domain-containing protein [Firmicutes bacterium]|nr:DUF1232 domain-containing protein [Bacillota bacterium]
MQFLFFRVLFKRIKAIVPFMKDKKVPLRKKLLIVIGVVYLLMPVDLIPIIIPVFGFLDDIILWAFIILYLKDELDRYWVGETPVDISKDFKDKTIIQNVRYEERNHDQK